MLGALCQLKGSDVYTACRETLLKSVSDNLERRLPHDSDAAEWMETDRLVNKLVASHNQEQVCNNNYILGKSFVISFVCI